MIVLTKSPIRIDHFLAVNLPTNHGNGFYPDRMGQEQEPGWVNYQHRLRRSVISTANLVNLSALTYLI